MRLILMRTIYSKRQTNLAAAALFEHLQSEAMEAGIFHYNYPHFSFSSKSRSNSSPAANQQGA